MTMRTSVPGIIINRPGLLCQAMTEKGIELPQPTPVEP
jgi:hypothetical protein